MSRSTTSFWCPAQTKLAAQGAAEDHRGSNLSWVTQSAHLSSDGTSQDSYQLKDRDLGRVPAATPDEA
jgi:hypothetical protein